MSLFVTCLGTKIDNLIDGNDSEGNNRYPYDIRLYILFSRITDEICQHYNIENVEDWKAMHRDCMLRLLLWFGVNFQCMDEIYTAPSSARFDSLSSFFADSIFADDMAHTPQTRHLYVDNFSLLFGGHQATNDKEEPIHQMPHQDFSTATVSGKDVSISDNQLLKDLTHPGSYIAPLDKERPLKFAGSDTIVTVKRGEIVFFKGDVTHCGVTIRAGMDPFQWNPCFHCLLCSVYHQTTPDKFSVDIDELRKSQPELVHLLNPESQEEVISKMLSDVTTALRGCSRHQSGIRNKQLLTVPNLADKMNELTTLFSEMQTNKKKRKTKGKYNGSNNK